MTRPLCVDLDGTLLDTDLLHEALLLLARRKPLTLLSTLPTIAKGKAHFKMVVASHVHLGDPALLPYNKDVLEVIYEAKIHGSAIVLATASHYSLCSRIADHLGLFDELICTQDMHNLSGDSKAQALVERFGSGNFDYIGNSHQDLPVFAESHTAYVKTSNNSLRNQVHSQSGKVIFLGATQSLSSVWLRALRVHQWTKNLLLFVPLLAAHVFNDIGLIINAILAFVSFSLCASSVYIANDLLDLQSDRRHRQKRFRPFAAGLIPISRGLVSILILISASFTITLAMPWQFATTLLLYLGLTTAYSFYLKRQPVVDVILLASLYTIRIIAGGAAITVVPSFWLLGFSMFIFLSLALVKRVTEIQNLDQIDTVAGRGYRAADQDILTSLGTGSAMSSVLVLALYTQSDVARQLYPAQHWLWIIPPLLLYWVSRLWFKARRNEIDEDPVVWAARDWQSLVVVIISGISMFLAAF